MSEQEEIQTALGSIWVRFTDKGKLRIWWPHKSRVQELVMPVIDGHANWIPEGRGWYVPAEKAQAIYDALFDL